MRRTLVAAMALAAGLTTSSASAAPDGANASDIERWNAAPNSHNIDKVMALFSPDVSVD